MPWILGVGVVALGYSCDFWLTSLFSSEIYEIVDDLILGVLVAIVTTWWLRSRNLSIRKRLNDVSEINHLVRNELQIILYSAHASNNEKQVQQIEQSVSQISAILRDLLGPAPAVNKRTETTRAMRTGN